MRTYRLGPQALACRALSATFTVFVIIAIPGAARAADAINGVVVDQSGQPLPRAFVRTLAGSGNNGTTTFSDEFGAFELTTADGACRIEASLTGFTTATASCTERPLRLVLGVAPVHETVVVSATRTETPAAQTGASVTAFNAEDLARRREPLVADLLRSSPGAALIRTGPPGAVTSLFVRGGESNHNKVLLDGIPLNEPGGTFNFSNLTTDNLERIEVVRGAQSALFGSDAMASVVQLFTKRADRALARPQAVLSLEGGTYDTVRGSGAVSGLSGPFDYSAGFSQYRTDNRVPNSDFRNSTLSANAGVAIGDHATLRAVARGELERTGTPGQTAFERPDLDAFFDRHDGVGGVTVDHQLTPAYRQRASYSLTVSHQQSTNLLLDPPYVARFDGRVAPFESTDFAFDSFNNLHRHHASYQGDLRLANDAEHGSHLLSVLVDWDGERATLIDRLASTSTLASRDNTGVSVQHQAVWRRVVATASARFEHNASFDNATVGRGSIVFVAHEGSGSAGDTRFHASAGSGIKEPTLLQSFSSSPFFRGNPNLEPERSRSIEAGVEQRLARDRVRIEANWFDNQFRNLIATRTTNPATFESAYFNIGRTRARGLEISSDAAAARMVHVRGGYTFLASEILDSTSPFNVIFQPGQWLFRRPRHSGYLGIAVDRGPLGASVNGTFIGRFVDSDFAGFEPALTENPGHATWDARVSYRVSRPLTVLLSIDNLTNNDYMEPLGYLALQRAVRVGLRATF